MHLPDAIVDRVEVVHVERRERPLAARELGREQLHPGVVADERQPPARRRELIHQVVLGDGSRREAGADIDEGGKPSLQAHTRHA